MQDITTLIAKLKAAESNVSDVAQSLKNHIMDLENQVAYFAFVTDADINKSLLRCYRRMMAHELGLINETESLRFENICRNAHMQTEGLLTFFYNEKFRFVASKFVSEHNEYVEKVNEEGRSRPNFKPLALMLSDKKWSRITYAEKNLLFQKYTLDWRIKNFLQILNNFRNSISHVGYVDKRSDFAADTAADVKDFASAKDVNAVLDALLKLRDYVEFNLI